jgi:hypothetical protein
LGAEGGEQMDMVGHYQVGTNEDMSFRSLGGKFHKFPMDLFVGQGAEPILSASGKEIDRAIRE